jgi:hypothetical protein
MAEALLFDEKICQGAAKALLPTHLRGPKPSSKHGSYIFWKAVCRKRDRPAHIQAALSRITGFEGLVYEVA